MCTRNFDTSCGIYRLGPLSFLLHDTHKAKDALYKCMYFLQNQFLLPSKKPVIFIFQCSDLTPDYCATNLCLALLLLAIISIPNVFSALIDSVVRRIEQGVVAARVSKEEKRTQHTGAQ